jgi:hypothetical protein
MIKDFTVKKPTIIAIFFFVFAAIFFYLGNSVLSCNQTLSSGPGDQTSGLIWLNSVVNTPLWGFTDVSNAPYGENLQSPVFIMGALQYLFFWFTSLFVGPVCGYNLYTLIGFLFSSLVVFFYVKKITGRYDVALFAGFAAAFTPYLQIKTGVHPSYVFFGVFILGIWTLQSLWEKPSYKYAILLGLIGASYFFIDPYFIIIGFITLLSAFTFFFFRTLHRSMSFKRGSLNFSTKKVYLDLKPIFKKLFVSILIVFILAVLPLIVVYSLNKEAIKNEVGSVRSDIKQEAFTYAARPSEYLPPNSSHPFLPQITSGPDVFIKRPHGSNPGETTLTLSVVVLSFVFIGTYLFVKNRYKHYSIIDRKTHKRLRGQFLLFIFIATVALLTSFPPHSFGIHFPSDLITSLSDVWRVFARFQVIVASCLAIASAVVLHFLLRNSHYKKRYILIGALIALVAFEYLTFNPFKERENWSYDQVHPVYYWLKKQKNIDTIAEYPLNEPGQTAVSVSYFTAQYVHKKKLINASRAAGEQVGLRLGLRDLSDPQTAPTLASMGVDVVLVHTENQKKFQVPPGYTIVDWNKSDKDPDSIYYNANLIVLRVVSPKDLDDLIVAPKKYVDEVRFDGQYLSADYVSPSKVDLMTYDLSTGRKTTQNISKTIQYNIILEGSNCGIVVKQGGRVIDLYTLPKNLKTSRTLQINTNKPINFELCRTKDSSARILIGDLNLL